MVTKEQRVVLQAAIETYGKDRQIDKFVEEMAETIQAVQKCKYDDCLQNKMNLVEEMADLCITTTEMFMMLPIEQGVQNEIEFKVKRLKNRMEAE